MHYLLLFVVLLEMTTCTTVEERSQPNNASVENNWSPLLTGQDCGIEESRNLVVKSQDAFDTLWKEMQADRPDQPQKPRVDFSTHWVIACFLGNVSSAGHSIAIKAVTKQSNQTLIELIHKKPGAGCLTAQVIESPFLLAAIEHYRPETTKFTTTVVETNCE